METAFPLKLVQVCPRKLSTYILPPGVKHRSFSHSVEAYINAARKEVNIILENGVLPDCDVRWHFLKVLTLDEIREVQKYVFNRLRRNDVTALAFLEPTKDKKRNLTDRVHFHLLSVGGQRASVHIRSVIRDACTAYGWEENEDYRLNRQFIWYPESYPYYVLKGNEKYEQRLFNEGLNIQRLYTIGKWYRDTKENLWNVIKQRCAEQNRGVITEKVWGARSYAEEYCEEYEYGDDGLGDYCREWLQAKEDAEMYDPEDYEDYTGSQPSEATAGNAVEARKPAEKLYRPKSVQIVKTAGTRRYSPVIRGRRAPDKVKHYTRE